MTIADSDATKLTLATIRLTRKASSCLKLDKIKVVSSSVTIKLVLNLQINRTFYRQQQINKANCLISRLSFSACLFLAKWQKKCLIYYQD
jgi:hypothetical protein